MLTAFALTGALNGSGFGACNSLTSIIRFSTTATSFKTGIIITSPSYLTAGGIVSTYSFFGILALNVDERAAWYGYTGGNSNLSDVTSLATSADESTKIPVIEENLQVGKREVFTGGVRLRSRIVERPVEESLRLREENVTIERTPVNRPATSADLANFQGTQIEMTESAEVPVVSKEARVVEEVSLGKEVQERTETISGTVRKTEVDVENIGTTDTDRSHNSNLGSR